MFRCRVRLPLVVEGARSESRMLGSWKDGDLTYHNISVIDQQLHPRNLGCSMWRILRCHPRWWCTLRKRVV